MTRTKYTTREYHTDWWHQRAEKHQAYANHAISYLEAAVPYLKEMRDVQEITPLGTSKVTLPGVALKHIFSALFYLLPYVHAENVPAGEPAIPAEAAGARLATEYLQKGEEKEAQ